MIVGSNLTNFINYLYHLLMGRVLGPVHYGELAALFSFIGLISIFPSVFGPVVTKFISAADNEQEVQSLVNWFEKRIFLLTGVIAGALVLTSPLIASFLQIENWLLVTTVAGVLFFSVPAFINRSILQGVLRFSSVVISQLLENAAKLLFGIGLVWLGWSVMGAMVGFILAVGCGYLFTFYYVHRYRSTQAVPPKNLKKMLLFTVPILLQLVAFTSLYTADVMLVKHYFSAYEAGLYAALSTLGRIVFFGTGPVSAVMFPLVARRKTSGENYQQIFLLSLAVTFLMSVGIVLLYWLFPYLAVTMLYGSSYLPIIPMLVLFAIYMSLFTLSSLIVNYYLSLGITRVVAFPLLAAVAQLIGISLYHQNLYQVIYICLAVGIGLFVSLLLYWIFFSRNEK